MKKIMLVVLLLICFVNLKSNGYTERFIVKPIEVILTGYYTPVIKASSNQTNTYKYKNTYYNQLTKRVGEFYTKNYNHVKELELEGQLIVKIGYNSLVLNNDWIVSYLVPVGAKKVALKQNTIAVDPKVIPLNSDVLIDGKWHKAADVGKNIKNNRIDIYFGEGDSAKIAAVSFKKKDIVYIKLNAY
jgi:3D (Asp-Asp-Asp) domain-containing protein